MLFAAWFDFREVCHFVVHYFADSLPEWFRSVTAHESIPNPFIPEASENSVLLRFDHYFG